MEDLKFFLQVLFQTLFLSCLQSHPFGLTEGGAGGKLYSSLKYNPSQAGSNKQLFLVLISETVRLSGSPV